MSSPLLRSGETFDHERLFSPAEALAAYAAAVPLAVPAVEHVALGAAFGRILAVPVTADADYPADRRSTMDGFAVRSADGDAGRRVTGEIRMGVAPPGAIGAGEAMRIPTGGVLPDGADAVLPVEDTDVVMAAGDVGEVIAVRTAPAAGDYFTPVAADMAAGTAVLRAGRRIGAPELGVLATLGVVAVPVFRRPAIAIVSTGDELVDAGNAPGRGQVRDSNRWAIGGTLLALGCDPVQVPRAADEPAALEAAIRAALAGADGVILTGGSSVGLRDLTPRVIDALGRPGVIVHGLRVKPGKPTVLAAIDGKPIIGLPGNPASSLMILEAIVAPLIRALTGNAGGGPVTVRARAAEAFAGRPGWTWYVPAELRWDGDVLCAVPMPIRSAHTSLLARAHGYVVVGAAGAIPAGNALDVVRFSSGGRELPGTLNAKDEE